MDLPEYVKLSAVSVGNIRMLVLCHRTSIHTVSRICSASATTCSQMVLGDGGAVAIGFQCDDTTFCFINVRIRSEEDGVEYRDVVDELSSQMSTSLHYDILHSYQHIFLCGDFNCPSEGDFPSIVNATRNGHNFEELIASEWLTRRMKSGQSFCGFSEGPLTFGPTCRYLRNTTVAHPRIFDEWLQSVPSWSDRILFRDLCSASTSQTKCLQYEADHSLMSSTHSPVVGVFEINSRLQYVVKNSDHQPRTRMMFNNIVCEFRRLVTLSSDDATDHWVCFLFPLFSQGVSQTRTMALECTSGRAEWTALECSLLYPVECAHIASEQLHIFLFQEDRHSGISSPVGQCATQFSSLSVSSGKISCIVPMLRSGFQVGSISFEVEVRYFLTTFTVRCLRMTFPPSFFSPKQRSWVKKIFK